MCSRMNEPGRTRPRADLLAPEGRTFRDVLGKFASGVVVLTGRGPVGLTCQSFFSLSLDPPLIAIAPGQGSRSWARIRTADVFGVNVLAAGQQRASEVFGSRREDKFAHVDWVEASSGTPRLEGALAYLECRIESSHPAGDHYLVTARVLEVSDATGAESPLLFYRGAYHAMPMNK